MEREERFVGKGVAAVIVDEVLEEEQNRVGESLESLIIEAEWIS